MKLIRRNAGKRKIFAPTTTVASSDLKSRGVRMSDDSWNFVETFAYNERLGKTDAFEVIVQTFKKWYEEEVNND